jgi:hypothetical protein
LPRMNATTRSLAALYPWHFGGGLACAGPVIGIDYLTGGSAWTFDPFELVDADQASNPNVVVAGEPGMGKSGVGKTAAWWLVGAFGYRLVVVDVKSEYTALGAALGCDRIALHPHGTSRVNPMTSDGTPDGDKERLRFVAALASILAGRSLTAVERVLLDESVAVVAEREPEPLLRHLVEVITELPDRVVTALQKDRQDLLDRTDEIRYALRSLVTGALAGMFDAPTNVTIDPGSPGLILDVSTAGNDDELLQLSMLAGLRAVSQLRAAGTRRTLLYADETWRLATTSQTVRFLQHSWKLGRQTGTSCWAIIHRFSDLAAQSDDGTALAKVTRALVADSGTHILFRHGKREDAELTAAELSLPAAAVGVLQKLPIHRALVHCGGRLAVVEARFNDTLAHLAYTNQAMGRVA